MEAMSKGEYADAVVFLKVDVDENEDAAAEYNITAMPTFIFIKNGNKVCLLHSVPFCLPSRRGFNIPV